MIVSGNLLCMVEMGVCVSKLSIQILKNDLTDMNMRPQTSVCCKNTQKSIRLLKSCFN